MNTYTIRHYIDSTRQGISALVLEATSFDACMDGLKLLCFDLSTLVDIAETESTCPHCGTDSALAELCPDCDALFLAEFMTEGGR